MSGFEYDYSSSAEASSPEWKAYPQLSRRRGEESFKEAREKRDGRSLRRKIKAISLATTLATWIGLTTSHAALGISGSVRIPGTPANVTLGLSMGHVDKVSSALPTYIPTYQRYNGANISPSFRIRTADVHPVFIIGQQKAPFFDIHVSLQK